MRTLTFHQNRIRDDGLTAILKGYHLQQPIWSARGMSAYPWGRTWAIAEARGPHSPRRSWQQTSTPLQQPARHVYASWASSRGRPDPPKEQGTGEHCPQSQQLRHWRCSHRLPAVSRFRVFATQIGKRRDDTVFQYFDCRNSPGVTTTVPGGVAFLRSSAETENACFQPDIVKVWEKNWTRPTRGRETRGLTASISLFIIPRHLQQVFSMQPIANLQHLGAHMKTRLQGCITRALLAFPSHCARSVLPRMECPANSWPIRSIKCGHVIIITRTRSVLQITHPMLRALHIFNT